MGIVFLMGRTKSRKGRSSVKQKTPQGTGTAVPEWRVELVTKRKPALCGSIDGEGRGGDRGLGCGEIHTYYTECRGGGCRDGYTFCKDELKIYCEKCEETNGAGYCAGTARGLLATGLPLVASTHLGNCL